MTYLIPLYPLLFEPGDRLSREEFLKRWEQMPDLKFAELIDGVVYMPSPVSAEHATRDGDVHLLLATYAARSGVCTFVVGATWLMEHDSAPQPDSALRLLPDRGGRTQESGGLLQGAPELVVEVSRSSRSYDLGPKLKLYERVGVAEYVTVLIEQDEIQWRVLEDGRYVRMAPDGDGVFRSRVFPGLWLDAGAFWRRDLKRLLDVLEQGLASPECASFIGRSAL